MSKKDNKKETRGRKKKFGEETAVLHFRVPKSFYEKLTPEDKELLRAKLLNEKIPPGYKDSTALRKQMRLNLQVMTNFGNNLNQVAKNLNVLLLDTYIPMEQRNEVFKRIEMLLQKVLESLEYSSK